MNQRPKTRAAALFALTLASLSLAACGQGSDEPSQTTTKATAFGGNTTTQTGNAPIPVSPRGGPSKTVLWGAQIGDQLVADAASLFGHRQLLDPAIGVRALPHDETARFQLVHDAGDVRVP